MNRDKYMALKTMTGLTIDEMLAELQKPMPPAAYKPIPGAANLTDIDAAYAHEVYTMVWGVYGIGFGLMWEKEDLVVAQDGKKWQAYIDNAYFWVHFDDGTENGFELSFLVNGEAPPQNNRGYSVRGAITNALGAGAAKLLFQSFIYRGQKMADVQAAEPENPKYWELVASAKKVGVDLSNDKVEQGMAVSLYGSEGPKSLRHLSNEHLELIGGLLDFTQQGKLPTAVKEKTKNFVVAEAKKAIGRRIWQVAMHSNLTFPEAEHMVYERIEAGQDLIMKVGQEGGKDTQLVCGPIEEMIPNG